MTIQEALDRLDAPRLRDDDGVYHSEFDKIIEERLAELDPGFMEAMRNAYKKSNMSRWYA